VKVGMRAFATSLIYLLAELLGLGLGPWLIGILNDHFQKQLGVGVIRYTMFPAAVTTFVGGLLFVMAAQYLRRDMARSAAE
jgi:hypothetical protein